MICCFLVSLFVWFLIWASIPFQDIADAADRGSTTAVGLSVVVFLSWFGILVGGVGIIVQFTRAL